MELQLKVRGTFEYMIIDPSDWDGVRDVKWYFKEGVVVNGLGVPYDEFVGLGENMKNMYGHTLDKRRQFLIDVGLQYEMCESEGCYILKENKDA